MTELAHEQFLRQLQSGVRLIGVTPRIKKKADWLTQGYGRGGRSGTRESSRSRHASMQDAVIQARRVKR